MGDVMFRRLIGALATVGLALATAQAHEIGAAKLIVSDLPKSQEFFEKIFGMKETSHFSSPNAYDEPIMSFEQGARLALFNPKAEPALKKSTAPVVLIYTPEFDAVVKRIQEAKYPLRMLPAGGAVPNRIAIATEPSGNAVEILDRPEGKSEVGGAKLIVDSRQKAEDFYAKVFGVQPLQRFQTKGYDEVLMNFGSGAWLALFESKTDALPPKSQFPVVAIYTTDFDEVLKRVQELGLGFREVKSSQLNSRIIVAKDPAGNAVEIIKR
jgi:predicted enzyme related to lactoylglutathione lyase